MRLHGCCPRSRMFRGERCAEPRAFGVSRRPQDHGRCRATAITRTLYENLFVLAERGTMFGHQIPTLYGLDNNRKWWAGDDTDLSDTKYLTGSHPAVCGWELSNIELDMETNIDGELFTERFRGIAPIPFRAETRGTGRAPSIRSFRAARTTKSSKAGSTRSPISC